MNANLLETNMLVLGTLYETSIAIGKERLKEVITVSSLKTNTLKKLIFALLVLGTLFLSSCYSDGYGCRGRSHLITRVR